MSLDQDMVEKRRSYADFRDESGNNCRRVNVEMNHAKVVGGQLEGEKRVRREIANCNERRRMQSINSGFDSLRVLLPPMTDGEKVSKATILQLTAKYIHSLVTRVNLLENEVLVYRQARGVNHINVVPDNGNESVDSIRKRKSDDTRKGEQNRVRRSKLDNATSRTITFDNTPDDQKVLLNQIQPVPYPPTACLTVVADNLEPVLPATDYTAESPRPESTSCTAARLEHLVMAIEQIEGGRAFTVPTGEESPVEDSLSVDRSPSLPGESIYHSQENYHHFPYGSSDQSMTKQTDVFPDEYATDSTADLSHLCKRKVLAESSSADDYPIVAKLLNRPIPHKYLHRPQVVVNSTN